MSSCESLKKLDLTVNFIGALSSVENLVDLYSLEELFLTGNPCTDYPGYKQFVITTLPQLQKLDGNEISKVERIQALQAIEQLRSGICRCEADHAVKRSAERQAAQIRRSEHAEKLASAPDSDIESVVGEFWNEKVAFTPESRVEMQEYIELQEKARKGELKADKVNEEENKNAEKRSIKLFSDDGRPYNINQAKYMDTSLLNCDVQPNYVRVTVKQKILQLALPDEINPDRTCAKRSQTTGHLVITMPKANQLIGSNQSDKGEKVKVKPEKKCNRSIEDGKSRSKTLLDCEQPRVVESWCRIVNDDLASLVPDHDDETLVPALI